PEAVEPDDAFLEIGMDSVSAAEVRAGLADALGVTVTAGPFVVPDGGYCW
ncbi:acyl carrier protein, partial [[Kitasatospora] papulosa]